MSKKSILIVMPDMNTGGAQRSLISLINLIDLEKLNVTLAMFRNEGMFLKYIPNKVNIIEIPTVSGKHSGKDYIKYYIKKFNIYKVLQLGLVAILNINRKRPGAINHIFWNVIKDDFKDFPGDFDVAIGYIDTIPTWYVVDKVNAHRKITFNRNDYNKLGSDKRVDFEFYNKLDLVAAVSEECKNILCENFPSLKTKFVEFRNITNSGLIKQMALEGRGFEDDFKGLRILTVARTSYQKGIDLAIEAAIKLHNQEINFKWYIIGRDSGGYDEIIYQKKMSEYFMILPETDNPYPYMKQCDIYVQPSRWEGRCNTIIEAKILAKPIITFNYDTVRNQIKNLHDGLILDMTSDDLACGINRLINDKVLADSLAYEAGLDNLDNIDKINEFYSMILGFGGKV